MRFIVFFIAIFVAACGEISLPNGKRPDELVVLTLTGATTYSIDQATGETGFDYDLVNLYAQEQGLKLRIIVAKSDKDIAKRLKNGEGHLAAAWLTAPDDRDLRSSIPYFQSQNVLITHEASLPLTDIKQLAHKTVHVVSGSRQEAELRELAKSIPDITIVSERGKSELDLMENLAKRHSEAALVDNAEFNIGSNFYPELQVSLKIGSAKPVVWLFAPQVAPEMLDRANAFLQRVEESGELDQLEDRYFGHVERLSTADIVRFIEQMRSTLPRHRAHFEAAQVSTGIDWRLLAALAYQESQWNPLATSRTGVRGMMMLTEDTADHLGVSNRLDPKESIMAGARYLAELRDGLPASIGEPDRLWLALAAYNLGMGHLNAARHIAKTRNANPDSWYEMKKVLPLLAKPQVYSRLKSGKGRGGEAVIMTENIRVYVDILNRHEAPYSPYERIPEKIAGGHYRPLHPAHTLKPPAPHATRERRL